MPKSSCISWGTASDWRRLGITYRGFPLYVSGVDGSLAYEADGSHLVGLSDDAEAAIADILTLDYSLETLPAEALEALKKRAN